MKSLESPAPSDRHDGVVFAAPQDREAVMELLARAFQVDPVARWAFPDPATYVEAFSAFADAFGGPAFDHGAAWMVPGFRGAALWLPPGVGPDEQRVATVLERYVPPGRLPDLFVLMDKMARHHPPVGHWHLPLIGVDPLDQGRGHGSALLRAVIERLDRDGQVAYLESTNPSNVPFYRRHGFEVVVTIEVADAPPVHPMMRTPR
jgi:ribosomal protein S18 acetylase RimI-like enzyme